MPLGRQGPLSRGISSAIGLATEAYAHHQEKKQIQEASSDAHNKNLVNDVQQPHDSSLALSSYDDHAASSDESSDNEDEENWIRDEIETQLEPSQANDSREEPQSIHHIIETFTHQHPPSTYQQAVNRLPCAVVIPQRRPHAKTRGFVRAYTPVLQDCGIDEATFMDFHEGFPSLYP